MHDRSPWPRRLIAPLAILVIAAGLSWWSSRAATRERGEVHAFVTAVCTDTRQGTDPSARLAATGELLRNTLVTRLRQTLGDSSQRLTVEVADGDTPGSGAMAGVATHTARLNLDGAEVLGLRLVHPGNRANIAIIGFWSE